MENDMKVQRSDSLPLDATYFTDEGYLVDHPIVTSVGIFVYHNPDGSERRELRFANSVVNFQAKASVILTTLALLMPGAQCQKRHWRIGHLGRNSMRVFLALIFTKQPDFIAIILFIHQACAKLRPGR